MASNLGISTDATMYDLSNEAQAAVLLGGRAHHLAQALGYNALACDIRGAASCGDDTLDSGEACDDGNLESGDGCDLACRIEATP